MVMGVEPLFITLPEMHTTVLSSIIIVYKLSTIVLFIVFQKLRVSVSY